VTLLSFATFEGKSSVAFLDSAEETCSKEEHFAIASLYSNQLLSGSTDEH
jgi:hypothetical protein